ncbi:MAG: L,D-transpeptidase family protein [Thermoflexales bacterium]|nr:L,D-transpeptidase family protein [Thermoflexales bacterium]MBP8240877.1 L,D-transpeptidase family protein [Thermoflexales bacterium]
MRKAILSFLLSVSMIAAGFLAGVPMAESAQAGEVLGPFLPDNFAAEDSFVYIVKRGDTLYGVAIRYGVSADAITRANGLKGLRLLYTGQRLLIPTAAATPPKPAPAPAPNGKLIKVSINQQRMWIYNAGKLVKTYVVSTGMAGRATRPGNYRVQTKMPEAYASTWGLRMPSWLGIYNVGALENGIHALPINRYGQVLWAGLLGRPASFGCVILGTADARELYNWAPMGTPVQIVY